MSLCEYGCGQSANHRLKNGKYCCSKSCNSCPSMKEKNSKSNIGRYITIETRMKLRNFNLGKRKTPEIIKKLRLANKNTIKKIKLKYSFFSKIEKMRYNPKTPTEKEIQVHCKNHDCKNSKEKGGWFTPTFGQIAERIRQLEAADGNEGSHFYCSESCKQICPIYKSKGTSQKIVQSLYNTTEYKTFRLYVLERDEHLCQYCGEEADHVHHERPQKLEPFFALDPDFAWSVCTKCHYKFGHVGDCSTGNLAKMNCDERIEKNGYTSNRT